MQGSKHFNSKDRLSLLLCMNMAGTDKLPTLLVGKAVRPHALKRKGVGLSKLKVIYYQQQKVGWITAVVFEHWLDKWNERLARQQWHILLLIDNIPSHITKEYSNISVEFLPPNTTSKLQLLDQGIIHVCKIEYYTILNNKLIWMLDNEKDVKKVMAGLAFITACETL